MPATGDPYNVLGVSPNASDEELHAAYRRLVREHHPDHNRGSAESARRFEEIQDAYARIRGLRKHPRAEQPPPAAADPDLDARLADLEQRVQEAQAARERVRRTAAEAAANESRRPSDDELGYVKTDDSFAKILADAEREFGERLAGAPEAPAGQRVGRLIDELAAKLRGGE